MPLAAAARAQTPTPPPRRPVSQISSRLLMVQGRPAVPVADLALALGSAARLDEAAAAYRILPGAAAILRWDAAARGVARRGRPATAVADGTDAGADPAAAPALSLFIGGALAADRLLLQGREPYLLLDDLAAMFGAVASFDPTLGQWFLVGSRPGSILAFR